MGDNVETLNLDPETARTKAKLFNAYDFPIGVIENALKTLDEVYWENVEMEFEEDLFIKICLDREAKTITIQDNGKGMTKADLIKNVVTSINVFLEGLMQATQDDDMQTFGGNLFCVFNVSKKFQVVSKHDDDEQYILASSPDSDTFTIQLDEGEPLGRGTKVIVTLKDTHTQYLQENMIRDLVKTRYKGLATYPIKIMDTVDVEALICQARSILNFHQSLDAMVEKFDQLQINTEDKLCQCIELIFEKMLDEPSFSVAFGRLFQILQNKQVMVKTLVEGPPPNYSPVTLIEPFNLPKFLTSRCRKEMNRYYMEEYRAKHKADLAATDDEDKKAEIYASWEDAKRKARTKSMGQIKIICELHKLKMLKGPAIRQMLTLYKDEEFFENLCKVLATNTNTTNNNNDDDLIKSDDRLNFSDLSRELGILEPGHKDACESELASSSVINGFFNVGSGEFLTDGREMHFTNKRLGMCAVASSGLVFLGNADGVPSQIETYLNSPEDNIKAGGLLACGIANIGNTNATVFKRLSRSINDADTTRKLGSIFGLGLAYAGSNKEEVIEQLLPVFNDPEVSNNMEVVGVTALALGFIGVGSENDGITSTILETLMKKTETELQDPFAKYLALGIGLCYLGKQEAVDVAIAAIEVLPDQFRSMATRLVENCAHAGTGNTSKCNFEKEESASSEKAVAVLGFALVHMGTDIGRSEMIFNEISEFFEEFDLAMSCAMELALGLLCTSDPRLNIINVFARVDFKSESDSEFEREFTNNSIMSMGLAGAGTKYERVRYLLKQLAQFHAKDAKLLFMVRIAQGLVHMGNGTKTLNPLNNGILSPVAVAGLLGFIVTLMDVDITESPYLIYCLALAMQPKSEEI